MKYKNFNAENWITPAHFKIRGVAEECVTQCTLPNENRFFNCSAEKTLGKTRNIRYVGDQRIVIVPNTGNLYAIRAICETCIHNKANQR